MMASKVLMSSASPLVPNRAPLSPFSVGLGPHCISFSSSSLSKKPSSRSTMAVKAQQQDYRGQGPLPISNTGPVRAPWTTTEDDYEIKMRIDMPGVAPEDIDVKVEGDMLVVKDLARQIYSPYNTEVRLPPSCAKQETRAILKNGVLHVTVPKIPKFQPTAIHVPVRPAPLT